jgi:adenine-specific DNA-methyltransferase
MMPLFESLPQIENAYNPQSRIVLYPGDVNELLATIPDQTAKLIITSPPYNLGKDYEDRRSIGQYLRIQAETITQLVRVLRDDRSLCWQVGNFVEDGEIIPLDILYYPVFKEQGLILRKRGVFNIDTPVLILGIAK